MDISRSSKASSIQRYFTGTNVFITGATGFLGQLILEKLLRTCTSIKKVFILIRDKKGNSIEKRLENLLNNPLFDVIKKEEPEFINKIVLVSGDCALPDLGISVQAQQELIENVNCVFHCAATISFNEKLKSAIAINVRATRDLLSLSKRMVGLKSFIYVSTAYSNCNCEQIDEVVYKTPINAKQLLTIFDTMDEELLDYLTTKLLGSWPNTYTFTKAVAEEAVLSYGKGLPIAIVRPSIIFSTVGDPVSGWINGVYGVPGIVIGMALGIIRTFHCNLDLKVDIVPADYVVNAIIAVAWEVGTAFIKGSTPHDVGNAAESNSICKMNGVGNTKEMENQTVKVYNYVSSNVTPITFRSIIRNGRINRDAIASHTVLWDYVFVPSPNYSIYRISEFVLHSFPAYIYDWVSKCMGKQPRAVKLYSRIRTTMDVMSYFTHNEWQFSDSNTQELWSKLDDNDKTMFKFDLTDFDWSSYMYSCLKGARLYILKQPPIHPVKGRDKLRNGFVVLLFVMSLIHVLHRRIKA